jgi:hypothetical protein
MGVASVPNSTEHHRKAASVPDTTQEATGIKEQYAAQVAADLERNIREQERVAAEVTSLEEQLRVLRQDHALLVSVQEALGGEPAGDAAPDTEVAQVPKPRRAASSGTGTGTSRRRKAAPRKSVKAGAADTAEAAVVPEKAAGPAAAVKADAPEKPVKAGTPAKAEKSEKSGKKPARAAKKPGRTEKPAKAVKGGRTAAAGSAGGRAKAVDGASAPTLVALVRDHLVRHREPLSAAEIAAALASTHPERTVRPTVVRTTAEGLVAKGQVHRTKQGSSVFYTAADASSGPAAAQEQAPREQAQPEPREEAQPESA